MSEEHAPPVYAVDNTELTNAWNQHIIPHLLALRSHFSDMAYKEGLAKYQQVVIGQSIQKLIRGTNGKDDFIRGQIAAYTEIMRLPEAIERHIEVQEKAKKQQYEMAGVE